MSSIDIFIPGATSHTTCDCGVVHPLEYFLVLSMTLRCSSILEHVLMTQSFFGTSIFHAHDFGQTLPCDLTAYHFSTTSRNVTNHFLLKNSPMER